MATTGQSVFWRNDKRCWIVQYIDDAGRPKQKVISSHVPLKKSNKKDAHAWAQAWLAEKAIDPARTLARLRDKGKSLTDLVEQWKQLRANAVKDGMIAPATHQGSMGFFRLHILPAVIDGVTLGERPVSEFDTALCRKWLRSLRGKRSPSTVRGAMFAFRVFFDDAIAEEWTHHAANPLRSSAIVRELPEMIQHKDSKVSPIASLETAEKLMTSASIPLYRRVRYALVCATGARDGELSGLEWQDVDLGADPSIHITKALSLKGPEGYGTMGKTKNRRRRLIPLHPAAAGALREWREEGWRTLTGKEPTPEAPVFVGLHALRRGRAVRPHSARLLRQDLRDIDAEHKDLCFHDLRASFISWLTQLAVRETTVQRFVGQAGQGVTQRHYVHAAWKDMVEALSLLPLRWGPVAGQLEPRRGVRPPKPLTPSTPPPLDGTDIENMELFGLEPDVEDEGQYFSKPLPSTTRPLLPNRANHGREPRSGQASQGSLRTGARPSVRLGRAEGQQEASSGDGDGDGEGDPWLSCSRLAKRAESLEGGRPVKAASLAPDLGHVRPSPLLDVAMAWGLS